MCIYDEVPLTIREIYKNKMDDFYIDYEKFDFNILYDICDLFKGNSRYRIVLGYCEAVKLGYTSFDDVVKYINDSEILFDKNYFSFIDMKYCDMYLQSIAELDSKMHYFKWKG